MLYLKLGSEVQLEGALQPLRATSVSSCSLLEVFLVLES